MTRVAEPREDGPVYQMELISDGEKIKLQFEGDNEEDCGTSLCVVICNRYLLVENDSCPHKVLH